jgi:hypothetical protein
MNRRNTHTEKMKSQTTKLFIEDTGRNGDLEIAVVMPNDDIRIYSYTAHDLVNAERLSADFWRARGFTGRLVIEDSDLGTKYTVNVR